MEFLKTIITIVIDIVICKLLSLTAVFQIVLKCVIKIKKNINKYSLIKMIEMLVLLLKCNNHRLWIHNNLC